jgi:integrase
MLLLARVVNHGVEKGYCAGFNFKIKAPEVSNQRKEMLNNEEIQRLIQAISKEENSIVGRIMLLALYSGMRKGEILKLRWSDINFETGFITLKNAKSGDDEIIPLNSPTREVFANIERGDSEFVFPGKSEKKHIVNVTNGLNRIRDAAKLPKGFRPLHGLRHTYASILASSGEVDMYTLQRLLTHKDSKTTLRYAHLRDEALKKAADSASNIFRKIQNDSNQVIE